MRKAAASIALAIATAFGTAEAQVSGAVNWSLMSLTDEGAIPSGTTQTSVGIVSTVTWSTATDGGFAASFGNDFVSYETAAQGGISNFAQIGFDNASQDQDDRVTLDVAFSEAVTAVSFTLTDIDQSTWDDFIEVYYTTGSGYVNAKTGSYVTSIGSAAAADNENFGDGWEGVASADNTGTDGNIVFNFGTLQITGVRVVYFSGNDGSNSNPGAQQFGLGNIAFNRIMPNLSVSKTVVMSSESASAFAIPGADVQYTITAQNLGQGRVDSDAIVLIDRLPAELTFYNGDMDGGGPATGAVLFTQASGTSLTFTPATDLRYSNAVAPPASFAACSYTPSAGYDANVRHICLNPKGSMQGGTPVKSFSVSFRAQVK